MAERQRWMRPAIAAGLLALAIGPYLQTLGHGFIVYDDNLYITENPIVQRGLTADGVRWAFTTFDASNWHPLTWLSHMVDCTMFRQGDGTQWAGGHHLVNLLLHGFNTLLLGLAFHRMTGALWRAALIAALFAVHPLHVESVAWIAERKDLLSTSFGLLALVCFTNWASARRWSSYVLMLGFFALSLMAKPMLVTFPFLLLLLDLWPLRRWRIGTFNSVGQETAAQGKRKVLVAENSSFPPRPTLQILIEKVPLFGLSIASSVMTILAQRTGGAVAPLDFWPMNARLGNAMVSYAMYLYRTVWPIDLALLYPLPIGGYWPAWKVIGAIALLASISTMGLALSRTRPALAIGWLWFVGTLVPVIGLVQVGMQSSADRYMYLPIVGVFIMLAWNLPTRTAASRRASIGVCVVGLAFFMAITIVQTRRWQRDETLLGRTLEVTAGNFVAHNNLGHVHAKAGRLDEAMAQFRAAIEIKSDYAPARENLGNVLMRRNEAQQAIPHFEAALKKTPNVPRLIAEYAGALLAAGRTEDAEKAYRRGLGIDQNDANLHAGLAVALSRQNRINEALGEYEIALRLNPRDAAIHANYGLALAVQGRLDEAIERFREALRLRSNFPEAQMYLRTAESQQGNQPPDGKNQKN